MAKRIQETFSFIEYDSADELRDRDKHLVERAIEASENSYSPYSHFQVGAAVRLETGTIVQGANQENVSYPSGVCGESLAFFQAAATYPGVIIDSVAICGKNQKAEDLAACTPCGQCRQVMLEYELNQNKDIKLLLVQDSGKIWEVERVSDLLPMNFNSSHIN